MPGSGVGAVMGHHLGVTFVSFETLLALDEVEPDCFTAQLPGTGFFFGGMALALALRGAARTVSSELLPHSLHAYFLSNGLWEEPKRITVERVRDGRSFSTRRVTVSQGDVVVLSAAASFQREAEGLDWQTPPERDAPSPDDLEPFDAMFGATVRTLDVRPLNPAFARGELAPTSVGLHPYWSRAHVALPADPLLHACALAFASDYQVVFSASPPGERMPVGTRTVTLDHALWFHRPAQADDWMLFEAIPLSISRSRTLIRGTVRDIRGGLVASFTQEDLTRFVGEGKAWSR